MWAGMARGTESADHKVGSQTETLQGPQVLHAFSLGMCQRDQSASVGARRMLPKDGATVRGIPHRTNLVRLATISAFARVCNDLARAPRQPVTQNVNSETLGIVAAKPGQTGNDTTYSLLRA